MRKHKRLYWLFGVGLFLILVILPFGITWVNYQENFGQRVDVAEYFKQPLSAFPALDEKQVSYPNRNGDQLAGYIYPAQIEEGKEAKALLVLAHGLGASHEIYRSTIDYFVKSGFDVFAYDATATGASEGEAVGAMPQGVADLDYSLRYIKTQEAWADLPIVLWGHSWGAYSAGAILNYHPDVAAVIMLAGENSSLEIMRYQGNQVVGEGLMNVLAPYFACYERLLMGDYAGATLQDGLAKSQAQVLMIHSQDDAMVSYETGFQRFYDQYVDGDQVAFISLKDAGHDWLFISELGRDYEKNFKLELNHIATDWSQEERTDYYQANFDVSQMFALDEELYAEMLAFYEQALTTSSQEE